MQKYKKTNKRQKFALHKMMSWLFFCLQNHPELTFAQRKILINISPFTVARMPAKPVSEIRGAKYAQNSQVFVIICVSIC